jgi:hypothetical protein
MGTHKRQRDKAAQELARTVRVYGHDFSIDLKGDIFTPIFGYIGHIEDCRDYAELIHDLILIFENDGEI